MSETTTNSKTHFAHTETTNKYDFYLSGDITAPADYIEWFNIIRNAKEDDEVVIHINSSGGYLSTAMQFIRVMNESDAHITCSIEGECMSAATMIFLSGDQLVITPHSMWMVHNYRGGFVGKGGELYDNAIFEREWSIKFINDVYKYFLTEDEIEAILNGKDLWMDSEELAKRCVTRMEALQKEAKKDKLESSSK